MNLIDELVNETPSQESKRHNMLKKIITKHYVWKIIQYESFYNYKNKTNDLFDFCELVRKRIMNETKTINTISELFVISRVNYLIEKYMIYINLNNNKK